MASTPEGLDREDSASVETGETFRCDTAEMSLNYTKQWQRVIDKYSNTFIINIKCFVMFLVVVGNLTL